MSGRVGSVAYSWQPELSVRRRHDGTLFRYIELWHPLIWISIATKNIAIEGAIALSKIIRVYVFPDNFMPARHFQHAPAVRLSDERVAVW